MLAAMAGEAAGDVVNDFESWAKLSARLRGRDEAEADALLRRLGVLDVWDNADATWAKTLASEMIEMRMARVRRYAEIVAEELRERARERASAGGDFRQRVIYGSPDPARPPRSVKQIGGTPFSSEPSDRESTRRMRPVDAQRLADETAPTASLPAHPDPDEPSRPAARPRQEPTSGGDES